MCFLKLLLAWLYFPRGRGSLQLPVTRDSSRALACAQWSTVPALPHCWEAAQGSCWGTKEMNTQQFSWQRFLLGSEGVFPVAQVWFWPLAQKPGTLCGLAEVCPPMWCCVKGLVASPGAACSSYQHFPLAEGMLNSLQQSPGCRQLCPGTGSVPVLWQCSLSALASPELP